MKNLIVPAELLDNLISCAKVLSADNTRKWAADAKECKEIPAPPEELRAELMPISMPGHTVLKVIRPTDPKHIQAVSLQMPTDIATYIAQLINANREDPPAETAE